MSSLLGLRGLVAMRWLFGAIGFLLAGFYATWQANLLQRGFEFHHLGTLIAFSTALSMAIDVPTSLIADRVGHKASVLGGLAIYILGFLVPSFSPSPWAVVAAVIIIAIGDALLEGALETWSASLQRAESGNVSNRYFMGLDQAQRLGMILGAVAIPGFATWMNASLQLSWMLYALVALGVFVLASSLPRGPVVAITHEPKRVALTAFVTQLKTPALVALAGGALLFGMSDATAQIAFWARISELGITTPLFLGIIQASLSLSRLLGLQGWKAAGWSEKPWLAGVALMSSSLFYVLFALNSHAGVALALYFVRIALLSAYFSALRGLVQRLFQDSAWRATVASGIGTLAQIGTLSFAALVGLAGARLSPANVCALGAVLSFAAGVVFYRSRARPAPASTYT